MTTYRDILKWGDKREEKLSKEIWEIIKEQFQLSEEELNNNSPEGREKVVLEKKSRIHENIIQKFIEIKFTVFPCK